MNSSLWILNSSLAGILLASVVLSNMLWIKTPPFKPIRRPLSSSASEEKKPELVVQPKFSLEKIYKYDLFNTYVATEEKTTKQVLISPIPNFTPAAIAPTPEVPPYDFIAPLEVTVKGVIVAEEEERSVVMIEDETKKEVMYHLGDKIKDAQIIKIARNRIVFLRGANGQLETYFLRKEDALKEKEEDNRWKYTVVSTEPNKYDVDPINFKDEFDSLGNFLERTSISGSIYQKGIPIGVKVGPLDKGDIGEALGLQQGDIIISINNKKTAQIKERMEIYDEVVKAKLGDVVTVVINRNGSDVTITYKLAKIPKAKPSLMGMKSDKAEASGDKKPAETITKKRQTEREKSIKEFKQKHKSSDQNEAIAKIRQRLLDNLKNRAKDRRVR